MDPATLSRAAPVTQVELEALAGEYRGTDEIESPRLFLDVGSLYLDVDGSRLRVIRLSDGTWRVLGTGGVDLEATPADRAMRIHFLEDGSVFAELERVTSN